MHAFVLECLRQLGIADRVCGWGKGIAVGARRIKRLNNPSNLHCFSGAITLGRLFVRAVIAGRTQLPMQS